MKISDVSAEEEEGRGSCSGAPTITSATISTRVSSGASVSDVTVGAERGRAQPIGADSSETERCRAHPSGIERGRSQPSGAKDDREEPNGAERSRAQPSRAALRRVLVPASIAEEEDEEEGVKRRMSSAMSPVGPGTAPCLLLALLCLPPIYGAPHSDAPPVLSLNLGLNFKLKVRSRGPPRPTSHPQPHSLPPLGSGWDPGDEMGSGTPPLEMGGFGGVPPPKGTPTSEEHKGLELDIAIDLTAGLDPKVGSPPTSLLQGPPMAGSLAPTVPPKLSFEALGGGNGSWGQEEGGSGSTEPGEENGGVLGGIHGVSCWGAAAGTWGRAWPAHVFGAGAVFAALALLGLALLLRGGAGRAARPRGALLAVAGAARALPLLLDPYERRGLLPAPCARLLFELPFPCLGWGLARGLARPLPAALALLHVALAAGAVLAVAGLGRAGALLLLPRAGFVALALGLALALPAGGGCRGGALLGAVGVLGAVGSAVLQVYGVLADVGWAGPVPQGPWGWWGLQLGCRVAEVAMGGTVATMAMVKPTSRRRPAEQPEGGGEAAGGEAGGGSSGGAPPEATDGDGDPTAGYRPPTPINLRRSIDEALGARRGIGRDVGGLSWNGLGMGWNGPGMGGNGAAGVGGSGKATGSDTIDL
ncbi:proline-rich transmembrane protein 4 [Melopsittacus undulatus]|uniref:proline-rich transmembrane protein 4 n=1 Tax=Melopsittacus undulatus TaxID=13146 RepID=UPI00146D9AD0|nr:proline-rich transmembrane protein 4 [Melopsittacus undulatus]